MAKRRSTSGEASATKDSSIGAIAMEADALESSGDIPGAIRIYRNWLEGHNTSPHAWVAHHNLGVLLRTLGELGDAWAELTTATKLNPNYAGAFVNLGSLCERRGHYADAIAAWTRALQLMESSPQRDSNELRITLNNIGRRQELDENFREALTAYTRSLAVAPEQETVLYHLIYVRQHLCDWPVHGLLPGISAEAMVDATSAVAMLAISDDPAAQLRAALRQRPELPVAEMPVLAPASGYAHERLRIGYLSSNFGNHPVSHLTAELYELHDRNRFETFAFCWSPEDDSKVRRRIRNAMDQFVRIDQLSDEAAAHAIRDAEIDILIDLQGQTAGARSNILAYRPAPVQISYLGFPGTSGLPGVDYVLADRYVLPEEAARHFSERPLYLPDCFQVNDRQRVAALTLPRADYGLPGDAFVFCTFNKNTKFNPEFFSTWMRILERVPHGVLWLLAADDGARDNLLRHAAAHGIGVERLIFAPRVPYAQYLARYAAADLFLDISPFNGGTTVADALWMGLPVVTCSGRSFASRMGGSLLHAIGLPELITTTVEEYERLAVDLAADPDRLRTLKTKLIANKGSAPLFDTPRFVRKLEAIYEEVARRQTTDTSLPTGLPRGMGSLVTEKEVYFVVYAPAFQRTSGGIYAMHAMAEDMHLMGCRVGMLAGAGMPGGRVPLITLETLEQMRVAGMTIVAIYPEIVTTNVLRADYVVWWLLNIPGFLKGNWNGNLDWADRIVCFGLELGKDCRCDNELIYPLYDPDFFVPNETIPKTEVTYYVNRIFSVAEAIPTPVQPTYFLNPANSLSYKELRNVLWRSKVLVSSEWSGTLTIAQLCGVPVILLPSPILSPDVHVGEMFMHGSAWGYSDENVASAKQSLDAVREIHRARKAKWPRKLRAEIDIWITEAKRKT